MKKIDILLIISIILSFTSLVYLRHRTLYPDTFTLQIPDKNSYETKIEFKDENAIYYTMVCMANTMTVPVDGIVGGKIEITKQQIRHVKEGASILNKENEISDYNRIIQDLDMWYEGDFSDCVEQHNYYWELLGGTKGKAERLDVFDKY